MTKRNKRILSLMFFSFLCPLLANNDTTIKGGKMELINKGEEVVFTGGVKMEQGSDTLTAREMRTNQTRDKISAKGDVKLFRKVSSTETWRGTGERGFYDSKMGVGTLWGDRKLAYINKTEIVSSTISRIMEVWGDQIDVARDPKMTKVVGHVQGKTIDPQTQDHYEFFADQAVFDGKTKILILTSQDRARVVQNGKTTKREVFGRAITYYVESGRMISDGNAEAVMQNEQLENK